MKDQNTTAVWTKADLFAGMEYNLEKNWTWRILSLDLPDNFSAMRVQDGKAAQPMAAVFGSINGLLYQLNEAQNKQAMEI